MLVHPIDLPLDDLHVFGIDSQHGFLPGNDPLRELPSTFSAWEEVAYALPKLIVAGCLRRTIDGLPRLTAGALDDPRALRRAMMLLSYLGHGYVWSEQTPSSHIPENLAEPWFQIATQLGRPPVLSYASYALDNWGRIDRKQPVALENLTILQNFLGGADEDWFILIHVDIEAKAAQAIRAIPIAIAAAEKKDCTALCTELAEMSASLSAMIGTLRRMPEYCDPYIYYHRVRPYIHGWKNNPALPDGVIYTGVDFYRGKPQTFRGETGAQSGIIPALDAALGVAHQKDELRDYLLEMRDYMPSGHRAFVESVERQSAIRNFLTGEGAGDVALTSAYNDCLQGMEEFRSVHLEYAASYIFRQAQDACTNPNSVGTGGTPFMPYLKKHRDETQASQLSQIG
jgi:indoleamine 2,3-dioxygenase